MGGMSHWLGCVMLLPGLLLVSSPGSAGAPEWVAMWQATDCAVELEADRDDRVLRLRPRCPLSAQDAAAALFETLPELSARGDVLPRYRSIFLGRLVDYRWISESLALRAARSPEWDSRRGRPRSEADANGFVQRALLEGDILEPLAGALAREGIRVTGVSAEKVLILPVVELPFADRLTSAGVPAAARVPWDALVHLTLSPDGGAGSGRR